MLKYFIQKVKDCKIYNNIQELLATFLRYGGEVGGGLQFRWLSK